MACQPTTSTYSRWASFLSLNLNYHVEHHDFPNVPWSRLPAIKAAAPEFYDHLSWSNGFLAMVYEWLMAGHEYTYSCHHGRSFTLSPPAKPSKQEQEPLRPLAPLPDVVVDAT
mmetsp:Transcript_81557/g.244653  ORF Transcript_81557/g.244653 Transcript_81557/m.244653 type:complete len:113 (+) Transcript_81557:1761-2099(+)